MAARRDLDEKTRGATLTEQDGAARTTVALGKGERERERERRCARRGAGLVAGIGTTN